MTRRASGVGAVALLFVIGLGHPASAQVMPNAREMSGVVLPVPDLPAGTISVRVVRGGFDKNLSGVAVDFHVDGRRRTMTTGANGRAEVSGLSAGARVRVVATVDGERLESQEAVVGTTGLRIALVATDPEAVKRAEEDRALAAAPPVKGIVVLGPETRVIAQMSDDRLEVYYLLQIVNSARTPVDIGGPLVFDLPREARSSVVLDGSSPQATANGPRLTVTGPFAPGVTSVQGAYELPFSGDTARIEQTWPAALPQVTVMVPQVGGLTLRSAQLSSIQDIFEDGQAIVLGTGPGLAAGQSLTLEISGLPYRSPWPRKIALALAGGLIVAGLWGALTASPRRRHQAVRRAS